VGEPATAKADIAYTFLDLTFVMYSDYLETFIRQNLGFLDFLYGA
jgi:hypothetical protein